MALPLLDVPAPALWRPERAGVRRFNIGHQEEISMKVRDQRGFTLIELLIVVAIISILAVIAMPQLQNARMRGNETSAIGSLRAITGAEASYSVGAGGGGYAISLAVLGRACPGSTQGFISPDLGVA